MLRAWALVALAAGAASAQTSSFGLKAGVPLNTLMTADAPGHWTSTRRYTFGPTAEVGLPHRLTVEADLLYKRVEFGNDSGASAKAGRWELPLLVKYRFPGRGLRPFADIGASYNRVTKIAELRHRSTVGFVAGAGVEARIGVLHIAPEIRLTRWADRNFGVHDARLRSNLTQSELLVGFTF